MGLIPARRLDHEAALRKTSDCRSPLSAAAVPVLPAEEVFVHVYVLIHELLVIAIVRRLLGRRSEAGFLAEVARDWGHLFSRLPHQSEANRRTRWLWGAFEQIRITLAAWLSEDDCQQVDTSTLARR